MLGLTNPIAGPLLIVAVAIWGRLFWHELRKNEVSWKAGVTLLLILAFWTLLVAINAFL